ncbi:uncharacterized protein LOC131033169 isoform X2 [Cryptomeria japonica]|uniref:uncharacterized protein LOC131033169 isoform X2 n=1 Tax=Cryptomeria japonica TaxID=3369 RepID=UPI0027DA68D8|nr:uncharacterized protein LOC131033169 isoform X2 [Cryptomeria japonica]
MAPAKRRAGKASACQKWSLGDLVLAKVKGFPAWPAKISKPEDWGQTHDPRKVFVYFFGTKEIGFCFPTDIQTFTLDLKNKLTAKCYGRTASDFTRAVEEICEEYDDLETEKRDVTPEIHKMKARTCIDSSNDSAEKMSFKDLKMHAPTHELEEVLKVQINDRIQKHRETTVKKNDLYTEVHRQVDGQKKRVNMGAGESKEKDASLIKPSDKKEEKIFSELTMGVKMQNSVATPKTNHMRSYLREEKATSHAEYHAKNDLSCPASAIGESEIKKVKSGFRRTLESESYVYDHKEKMAVTCPLLKENGTSSPDKAPTLGCSMTEHQFEQKGKITPQEFRDAHLATQSDHLEERKMVTNILANNFEYFNYDDTEGNSQFSGINDNAKEEQDFEDINASPILNDKKPTHFPFVSTEEGEKEVTDGVLQHNSILKKKRNLLKKHNPGTSVLNVNQEKMNVLTEEENVFELLSGTDHRKKRTQLLKGRKHKLKLDETLHLLKRARSHSEDEIAVMTEGLNTENISSTINNAGKNAIVDNDLYSHHMPFKSNDRMGSSSPQIEANSSHGEKSSFVLGKAMCLPPKADKYRLRSSLPGDEAALPPSKRRHRAQEAMSACVAEAATASNMTNGSDGQEDAWGISSHEKPFTECFDSERKLVHGNEDCMKRSHSSFPVEVTGTVVKKSVMFPDLHQSYGSLLSEPSNCLEKKQVNSKFEDLMTPIQRGKWQTLENGDLNVQPKISDRLSLSSHKKDEWKHNGMIASKLPSPKKQDGSEIILRRGNSPHQSPIKVHGAVRVDADEHENKSKSIKVKRSCVTPGKKNGGGLRKDQGPSGSDKHNQVSSGLDKHNQVPFGSDKHSQGHLPKHLAVRKNEQTSPSRSVVEPAVDRMVASSKSNLKINGPLMVKSERVSYSAELHLEKGSKLRDTHDSARELKLKTMSKDSDIALSSTSMKHLIAAAQAKRDQARSATMPQFVANEETVNSIPVFMSSPSPIRETSSHRCSPLQLHSASVPHEDAKNAFAGVESGSPRGNVDQWGLTDTMNLRSSEEGKISSEQKSVGGMLSGDTEAAVARDTFEGMLETLSRTKESIGRATRHAIDCAKYCIATEIVELLVQRLENESSFHRRIDLFFLVDSITQCSHSQKGIAGSSYIPAVQGALPRLLAAAAPTEGAARENRRQCLKVLRIWLERKILPESILRQYMNDIGSSNDDRAGGILPRRPRVERAVDDPMREIEGNLDEYGSNANFHLAGFSMSNVFEDEEEPCASDWKKSDDDLSVEPAEAQEDQTKSSTDPIDRHRHILEDVDGELEMEDVSPTSEYDPSSSKDYMVQPISQDIPHCSLSDQSNTCPPLPPGSPPLPEDPPPSPPPLPPSPPPPPPSSPPPPPPSSPPFVCQPLLPQPYVAPLNDTQAHVFSSQQPSHIVSNATMLDSVCHSSSGIPLSQIHPGQNVTSFNSPISFERLHGAAFTQQMQMNNINMSASQQSYRPPPPAIALSNQFSYVRAEIPVQRVWLDSLSARAPECEKQSAQEDQWKLVNNDRSTRPENQASIHQAGGCMTTLCTGSSFMQEATPGMFWQSGGAQYPCGAQIPAQNLMIRAPVCPMPNMDLGFNAYSDQVAVLTGGMVADQVLIQMLTSRSGISAANTWRPT